MSDKRGRPREVEDPVRVSVSIPAKDFDRFQRMAQDAGHNSVARVVRELSTADNRHLSRSGDNHT